jgi:hypothetical protein
MPIKINLLAEALAAEDLRRRDPTKRAIFGGALVVALALVWSSSVELKVMLVKSDLSSVQTEIQQRTNEYDQVMGSLKKISDAKDKLAALQRLSDSRFLQGNLLDALQHTAVPGLQLTRLRVDQAYIYSEGSLPQTSGDHVLGGRPPAAIEKIVISLDARDSSANPGDQVNKFKDVVVKQPYFQAALDKTNGVQLINLSAPQLGADGKPYVLFTLECHYPDQTR